MRWPILVLLLFTSILLHAQAAATKLESALLTKGSLYKQEVFTVDNIPAFRMDAVRVTDLEKFTTVSGIKVIHRLTVGKELKSFYNYIDDTEVDNLLTALQYMKTLLRTGTVPAGYTEIKFCTYSGFQVSLSTIVNIQNKLDWSFQVYTNIHNDRTLVTLATSDIEKLQKTIEQAKAKW